MRSPPRCVIQFLYGDSFYHSLTQYHILYAWLQLKAVDITPNTMIINKVLLDTREKTVVWLNMSSISNHFKLAFWTVGKCKQVIPV